MYIPKFKKKVVFMENRYIPLDNTKDAEAYTALNVLKKHDVHADINQLKVFVINNLLKTGIVKAVEPSYRKAGWQVDENSLMEYINAQKGDVGHLKERLITLQKELEQAVQSSIDFEFLYEQEKSKREQEQAKYKKKIKDLKEQLAVAKSGKEVEEKPKRGPGRPRKIVNDESNDLSTSEV